MKHNLLLKFYRQYLNDSGVIYTHAMANLSNISFHFPVADEPETFNTSDNPLASLQYSTVRVFKGFYNLCLL